MAARQTGRYVVSRWGGEAVRAFVPAHLPPAGPALMLEGRSAALHDAASGAMARLRVAGSLVPSPEWFIYGFVRKEAVITSQIEGTEASLADVVTYEATRRAERPEDVEEVCNYVEALTYARGELARPRGLPLSVRLLCEAHRRLMRGARGSDKRPGEVRRTQNWIGGSRPGTARFVPPPAESVPDLMGGLERWVHAPDPLPPLVRCGLAHVQFETIHPFLDGNGRIGRLLIALLLEHWGVLDKPLLYLSLALKRRQQEYYRRLSAVREEGDWEGWTTFFLECVREAAEDAVGTAQRVFALIQKDRERIVGGESATVAAIRLLDMLPTRPVVTLPLAVELLETTKPTAGAAIEVLAGAGVLVEVSGKERGRVYAYQQYLDLLTAD